MKKVFNTILILLVLLLTVNTVVMANNGKEHVDIIVTNKIAINLENSGSFVTLI